MKKVFLFSISLALLAGCSIFGVHFKIHNPHRAGKYPKATEARTLLGKQDTKFRTCYDVKYYQLNVDFGKDLSKNKSITGSVLIVASAVTVFDTLQLDLAENMVLDSIGRILSGAADVRLKTFRKEGAVFGIMDKIIPAKQTFTLVIRYHGKPTEAKKAPWEGGFVRKEDNLKKPFWGVACETEGASLWWPCKDVMNDEPDSVDVHFIVPKGLVAVSNGVLRSADTAITAAPGKAGFHWHISYPINIYDITFYIGNYKLLHDTYYSEITHDTLQLNHYVLAQNYEKAKTHFQQLKKYLAFYEATFGPYPWYRDGFKLVESPYAGMEHQSAIAYGNGYVNDLFGNVDYIILHETAHEWWGNSVTASDLAEGWLHEGFATYAEALYVEKTQGHQAYENYLQQDRLFIVNRRPVVGKSGIRYFNPKDSDIYMKGTWVLHSLRYLIADDSLFFDIIHSFYMENRMQQITSEKLEALVNQKTGKDFHWFFQQYLHNRFTPELEYCIRDGKLFYRWSKTESSFVMPVKVTMTGTVPVQETISPVNGEVRSVKMEGNNTDVYFNTREFLFKPVENKSLAHAAAN